MFKEFLIFFVLEFLKVSPVSSTSANYLSCITFFNIFSWAFRVTSAHFIGEFYNTTKYASIYTLTQIKEFYIAQKAHQRICVAGISVQEVGGIKF